MKLAFILVAISWLSLFISTSAVHATSEDSEKIRCAELLRSKEDPRWFDLVTAVNLLNFSTRPVPINETDVANVDSSDLNLAVQSRLKLMKHIFDTASNVESAQLLLSKFENLAVLPERIAKPELLDRDELMTYLAIAKFDISTLSREAFKLTLLTLANRQPFLIINDSRTIPILAEALFSTKFNTELSPVLPNQKQFIQNRNFIFQKTEDQKAQLLAGSKLRLSALSATAVQIWNQELSRVCSGSRIEQKAMSEFAVKLGFKFEYDESGRGGGATSM